MTRTPTRRGRRGERKGGGNARRLRKTLARAERLLDSGDAAKAVPLVEEVLRQAPENALAHHLAAIICHHGGDIQAALAHARRAVEIAPDNAGYLNAIGLMLQAAGRNDEAMNAFRAAFGNDPNSVDAATNLGFQLRRTGDLAGALGAFGRAVALDGHRVNAYLGWVDLLGRATTPAHDPAIAADLLRALQGPLSAPEELAPAIAWQLRHKFGVTDAPDAATPPLAPEDPLLAAYLCHCLNIDPALERVLTAHRKRLLEAGPETWGRADTQLARLLALQGFTNEYAFFADVGESAAIDALADTLEADLEAGRAPDPRAVLAFAMYRPLTALTGALASASLLAASGDGILADVIRHSVLDSIEEQRLEATIPTLGAVADETSKKVRAQYEKHPYPRWTAPTPQAAVNPAALLVGMFPHYRPPAFLNDGLSVLIAGCGTGRHTAALVQAHPAARLTAIDLSRASLAYGMRMLGKLGIGAGVDIIQADILDAGALEGPFDMIQSVGVLHHMAEPIAGWRVLAGLLRPGGVMKIGLYSERGRKGVLKCRAIIAGEGIGSADADMRGFRRRLLQDPPGGDFDKVLQRADFYSLSMCRDLLFHVQEICYTPARIKAELAELGLRFIGFEETEALGLNAAYRARFPDSPNLDDLDNWEALEASLDDPPEGYVFWCRKPDA